MDVLEIHNLLKFGVNQGGLKKIFQTYPILLSHTSQLKNKALSLCLSEPQAEDGVGDCAGLRLIPGATRSGKQKTPGFLKSLLRIQDSEE